MGFPKPTPVVRNIMILCGVVWLAQLIVYIAIGSMSLYLGAQADSWWQVWRYLTFQFLHDPQAISHIAVNMLGLYFFGGPIEQLWGSRRFLWFYLTCGAFAGVLYVIMNFLLLPQAFWDDPLIGASGGVYAVILACAVLCPHMRVLLFFVLPISIRWLAVFIIGGMILYVLSSLGRGEVMLNPDFWSHIAHLGGTIAAAFWLWAVPSIRRASQGTRQKINNGAWERKMRQQQEDHAQVDRILDKIQKEGLQSLSSREKRILQDATEKQRQQDKNINRL